MDDNQIRIPSEAPLTPATDDLIRFYDCWETPEHCPDTPHAKVKGKFIDTYEEATQSILARMAFPAADDTILYSISVTDPEKKSTAQDIYERQALGVFDEVLAMVSTEKPDPAVLDDVLPRLHLAVYWARRADSPDAVIQEKLDAIEAALAGWFKELPEAVEHVEGEQVSQKESTKEETTLPPPPSPPPKPFRYFSAGPVFTYEATKTRTYTGLGISGELLVPFRKDSPWVLGGELLLSARLLS